MAVCGSEQAVHHFRSPHRHQPFEGSLCPAFIGRPEVVRILLSNAFQAEPSLAFAAGPQSVYRQPPRPFVAGNQQDPQYLYSFL